MSVIVRSLALLGIAVAMAGPVKADELKADEARHFIAGKHFSYSCFEGTSGHGRIGADGSAAGYIKVGSGPMRYVVLPAGTLRVRGDQYCASVRGIPFEPCFNLTRTSGASLFPNRSKSLMRSSSSSSETPVAQLQKPILARK